MKFLSIATVVTGLIGFGGQQVSAADDSTLINAEVAGGELTLISVDSINFGSQVLSENVVFPQQTEVIIVTDYRGNQGDYSVQAKLLSDNLSDLGKNAIADLKINGVTLTDTSTDVALSGSAQTPIGPENLSFTADLTLQQVEKTASFTGEIEWTLIPTDGTTQIAE